MFINETLVGYCADRVEFNTSRAYRKNDHAWIEQKNGSSVRKFVGHERYSGPMAGQTMAHLYGARLLYVNHFQPSFQQLERRLDGASVKKRYRKPATPCDRLLARADVHKETKTGLESCRARLDPLYLLPTIWMAQSTLAAVNASDSADVPNDESLERFLSRLPDLWREGEVSPTHWLKARAPHTWRTRTDPFEGVWCEILGWLQKQPDVTAAELLDRLMSRYPESYSRRQLRTLQRRVRQWRGVVAKQLVCSPTEQDEIVEADRANIRPWASTNSYRNFGNICERGNRPAK